MTEPAGDRVTKPVTDGGPSPGTPFSPGSRIRNYLSGLATGYARTFSAVAVTLWLTPFTLRYLDREEYAIFALASDVLMWLALLDFGITAGLRVKSAQLTGRPQTDDLNHLASTAVVAQTAIAGGVLLLGAGIAFLFPRAFELRPDLQRDAMLVVAVMVASSALSIATQSFSALLVAHQRIHIDNLIGLANLGVRTALTIVLLVYGWRLQALAIATLAATVASGGLAAACTFREIPGLRIRFRFASWDVLRSVGRLGVWFSLGGLAGILISSLDRIVTAQVLSVEAVTTFTLTNRLYTLCGGLLAQITDTARPVLGQTLGRRQLEQARGIYRDLVAVSTGASIVVAAAIGAGNAAFVSRWVGPINYGGLALDLALMLNLVVYAWVLPNRAVLSAGLIVGPQVPVRLGEAVLNVTLSILLGRQFGLVGVAAGTGIAAVLTSIWLMPLLTARMFERGFWRFLWDDSHRLALLAVLCLPLMAGGRAAALWVGGYPGAFLGASLTGAAGLGIVWLVVLTPGLRRKFRSGFSHVMSVPSTIG